MHKFSLKFILIALAFVSPGLTACAQPADSSLYRRMPWLKPQFELIQFGSRNAVQQLYSKWDSVRTQQLVIVHMGDSHLQPDVVTGEERRLLQLELGEGGQGMMFPFSTARTYSSLSYKSSHTGAWTSSRSIEMRPKYDLGFSGAACRTVDPMAGFTIRFVNNVPSHYTVLKVFCKKSPTSYALMLEDGYTNQRVHPDTANPGLPYILFKVNPGQNYLNLKVMRTSAAQTGFEFYGMSLESERGNGALLHTAGIGGARMDAILNQRLLAQHLPAVKPDLVIVDYGTNDYIYDDKLRPDLEADVVKIIQIIRNCCPTTSIILTSTQDMHFRGRKLRAGAVFARLMRRIALEQGCGFWDWYWLSGGTRSVVKWRAAGMQQPDMVHMLVPGAKIKGQLLFQSLLNTHRFLKENPSATSLQANYTVVDTIPNYTDKEVFAVPAGNGKGLSHTVTSGQTLSHIAARYRVSVANIMRWNRLSSTLIRVGQKLIIYPAR